MTQLYAISPPKIELDDFAEQLSEAFAAGEIAAFQLRLKEAKDDEIRAAVTRLKPICEANGAAFILNDRLDIALDMNLDGVHLGQEDLAETSVEEVKKQMPEGMVLGVTCHASTHLAMEAGEQGADYVAFGAFYPTTSKPQEKLDKWGTPEPEILAGWTQFSTLPCVAIGGITPENCTPLVEARTDFIAAINGIWNHPEGAAAGVKAYHAAIDQQQDS